jgi:hypothetical protein
MPVPSKADELRRQATYEDAAAKEERERRLALLEEAEIEANAAVDALKARWKAEDEARPVGREAEMERHLQGARDRDAARVAMGGDAKMAETKKDPAHPVPTTADGQKEAAEALRRHQEAQAAWVGGGRAGPTGPNMGSPNVGVGVPTNPVTGSGTPAVPVEVVHDSNAGTTVEPVVVVHDSPPATVYPPPDVQPMPARRPIDPPPVQQRPVEPPRTV